MSEKEILVYDIEVFAHDNLAVFKDINGKTVKVFHNNYDGCDELIDGKQLVGYNNHYYDDRILPKMIFGWSPEKIKTLNDQIIGGHDTKIARNTMLKGTYDCFQQIDVSRPSLKKIEGNLGKMILESDVPFDIDRPLTESELKDVIYYCSYDVANTVQVFKLRKDNYFTAKESLISMLPQQPHLRPHQIRARANDWNTTTISANVLTNHPVQKWNEIRLGQRLYDGSYDLDLLNDVPSEVRNLWETKEKGHVDISEMGCDFQFGFGGLHGANTNKRIFDDVTLWDVTSMYPHIIRNLHVLPASMEKKIWIPNKNDYGGKIKTEATIETNDTYTKIMNDRIKIKYTDPALSGTYKIVINSVYGNLRNQYSPMYNPNAAKSVCFYGQAVLWNLCKRISPYVELVNINTDGIGFIVRNQSDKESLKTIKSQWEQEYNLSLEESTFTKFVQKDVNNYIGVHEDGSLKTKGGDVARYAKDSPFRNNSCRIVDIAIVNKLIYGRDVIETILDNLDKPHLFQFIIQAGHTYLGTFDTDGHKYQNINRVFADKHEGKHLFKKRVDGGLVKFPNAPDNMRLYNDQIYDSNGKSIVPEFEKRLDKNYYYQLINKTLSRWE